MLRTLSVQYLRNLSQAHCSFGPRFNLITGENGSGKTTLLEAIYAASLGRSFRSRKWAPLIQYDQPGCRIEADLENHHKDTPHIKIKRYTDGNAETLVDHLPVKTMAELAQLLPVQLIHAQSFQLLESGPKLRRQYCDWGVFHQFEDFYPVWMRFQRVLKQRNAALKQRDTTTITLWDKELADLSEEIHRYRQATLNALMPYFQKTISEFLPHMEIGLVYEPGWDGELTEVLARSLYKDMQYGYTQYGAHKADIRINCGDSPAVDVLSRGQQKLLVCALQLAQGFLFKETKGYGCVYLIDDLPAELDQSACELLIHGLKTLEGQVFITAIQGSRLEGLLTRSNCEYFCLEANQIKALF